MVLKASLGFPPIPSMAISEIFIGRIKTLASLAGAALVTSSAMAHDFCKNTNTNNLVGDKQFEAQVRKLLGHGTVALFYPGPLDEQAMVGLGGPPQDIRQLDGQLRFAAACRPHSCDEKAAAVFACPGKVLAVGILHYKGFNIHSPVLTIYGDTRSPGVQSAFTAWRKELEQAADVKISEVQEPHHR